MFRFLFARAPAIVAVAWVLLLLSGCGGGATSVASVGSGGTGVGVTSGFGSVIVDGMRYGDAQASYASEEDQGLAVTMASTGMMLGQSLEFGYDAAGAMMSVMVSPELVGNVSAVSATGMTVLGTKVSFNSDTTLGPVTSLAGYASLSAIQVGDRVAVYGLLKTDSSGAWYVQASLIVQKPAGTGIRLSGYVAQYNASAHSFSIGSNTINAGTASILPAGATLSNGELVTVWSDAAPSGNVIAAGTIRIKWPTAGSSGNLTVSGAISGYVSAANFKLRNISVDAGTATIAPAGATLGEGKYVIAVGKFDAATNKLTATSVTVYAPAASNAVELHGTILNFVSAASFTVRGVVIDASKAVISGGTAAQLANGVFVDVAGAVVNNVVQAATVSIVALTPMQAPAGAVIDMPGTVTSYNPSTGTYTMTTPSGITMSGQMGGSMYYNDGTAANFTVGQTVNVRGMMSGTTLTTSVVSFTTPATGSGTTTTGGGTVTSGTGTTVTGPGMTVTGTGTTTTGTGTTITGPGMTVTGTGTTTTGTGTTITGPGMTVTGTGTVTTGTGTTTGADVIHLIGIAYNVTATSFVLNGVTIQINGVAIQSSVMGGGMMGGGGGGLKSGSRVAVDAQLSGGQYLATAITVMRS